MTNLSTRTARLLDEAAAKHAAYQLARTREMEIAKAQAQARVQEFLDARNVFLAALVDDEGVPLSRIASMALGTTNRDTAKRAVEAGRALRGNQLDIEETAAPEPEVAGPEKYRFDAEQMLLTVHLTHDDFEPYAHALPAEPSEAGEEFTFTYDGQKLLPVEDEWEHPVVAVMMQPKAQQEALAFIRDLAA